MRMAGPIVLELKELERRYKSTEQALEQEKKQLERFKDLLQRCLAGEDVSNR
jgi:hypothetical protein